MRRFYHFLVLVLALYGSGCSMTRHLGADEVLYAGGEFSFGESDSLASRELQRNLESALAPQPNSRFLGMPLGLWWYNAFYTKKKRGFSKWWQDLLGQEPVIYNPALTKKMEKLLENRLFNFGHFRAEVSSSTRLENRKAWVSYHLHIEQPFLIRKIDLQADPPKFRADLEAALNESDLAVGEPYNLDQLKRARKKMEREMKERGYFYFADEQLQFVVDTLGGERSIDLLLSMKKTSNPAAKRKMTVGKVEVHPDWDLDQGRPAVRRQIGMAEYQFDRLYMRPAVINRQITLKPGEAYNLDKHNRTLKRLVNLNTFRFVNIRFEPYGEGDSLLNMRVLLNPKRPNTVEGSIGLSYKTTGFIGPELSLSYINRNLFNGAELLSTRLRIQPNFPINQNAGGSLDEYELNTRLARPGLLVPFLGKRTFDKLIRSTTKWDLNYRREQLEFPISTIAPDAESAELLLKLLSLDELADTYASDSTAKPWAAINEIEFAFGFLWEKNPTVIHDFNPIRLGYQFGSYSESEVKDFIYWIYLLDALPTPDDPDAIARFDPTNLLSLERMIIFRPDFIFLFDSRKRRIKRHNYFFRGRLSYAGNIVLPQPVVLLDSLEIGVETLQTQFLQVETDTRYFFRFKERHTLGSRIVADVSVPLTNEVLLPFLDFYTVGGPNSVRPFGIRTIGPGSRTDSLTAFDIFQGKGDIKLEFNLEYRYQLIRFLEIALFADAGNVWLFKDDNPGREAQFQFSSFYKQLGFGMGMGLRFIINPLVLRFDIALPFADPRKPLGSRWALPDSRLGDLQFYIAFGYAI